MRRKRKKAAITTMAVLLAIIFLFTEYSYFTVTTGCKYRDYNCLLNK